MRILLLILLTLSLNADPVGYSKLTDEGLGYLVQDQTDNALKSFKESCDGGDATGCLHLGAMYMSTQPQEIKKASDVYKKSCESASIGCRHYEYTLHLLEQKGH